jgi:hypothetical protein
MCSFLFQRTACRLSLVTLCCCLPPSRIYRDLPVACNRIYKETRRKDWNQRTGVFGRASPHDGRVFWAQFALRANFAKVAADLFCKTFYPITSIAMLNRSFPNSRYSRIQYRSRERQCAVSVRSRMKNSCLVPAALSVWNQFRRLALSSALACKRLRVTD